jgi:hypothetical protein
MTVRRRQKPSEPQPHKRDSSVARLPLGGFKSWADGSASVALRSRSWLLRGENELRRWALSTK